ncbi:DUF2867 domain-containing protein [Streptomyces sp. NPDC002078]
MRHAFEQIRHGKDLLVWNLLIRPAHDTVVEELFDNIERALTGRPHHPVRWSPWVRLVNMLMWDRPVAAELPERAALARTAFARTDFADAWQLPLRPGMPREPQLWQAELPGRTFPVVASERYEILMGKDAWHLDYRASLLVGPDHVTLSSVVRTHNIAGRAYWAVIRRRHPVAARRMLRRVHRRVALDQQTRERSRADA